LGGLIDIEPVLMGVDTEEIQNTTNVITVDAEAAEAEDRRLVEQQYNPECRCNGLRVWVTFSVDTMSQAMALVTRLRSAAFLNELLAALRAVGFHWECIIESVDIIAQGPTSSPTAAPTHLPTPSPTYMSFPVLAINGGNVVTVEASIPAKPYQDLGAKCTDLIDGDLTDTIKVSGTIDLSKFNADAQILTYSCTNAGGATQEARRFVYVQSAVCPHCFLHGNTSLSVEASFPFVDDGITCTDNFPHPELQYAKKGRVEVEVAGVYKMTYVATDRAGNSNEMCGQTPIVRTVEVVDTLKPVIGLKYRTAQLLDGATSETSTSSLYRGTRNPADSYFSMTPVRRLLAQDGQPTSSVWFVVAAGSLACGLALVARIVIGNNRKQSTARGNHRLLQRLI
jgi:hypothetical protein